MDGKVLEMLIPSAYVRGYVKETGRIFSDKETAAMAHHSEMPLKEKYRLLMSLSETTDDKALALQVQNYLIDLGRQFEDFRTASKNGGKTNYIYVLYLNREFPEEKDICYGYYTDWGIACKAGRHTGEKLAYTVKKHEILTSYDYPDRDCLAEICFDKDGEAVYLFSEEAELVDGEHADDYGHFTNIFIELPNPFEKGDSVEQVRSGRRGIVATSREEWEESTNRLRDSRYARYYDNCVSVDMVTEDGMPARESALPIDLELRGRI